MQRKFLDYAILYSFIAIAAVLAFALGKNLLVALLFFYGPPAIWLSIKASRHVRRAAIFSFFGAAAFFVIDYISTLDGAWWISTIFPRALEILAIENSIWAFIGFYTIVLFYEYFDDGAKFHAASNRHTGLARSVVIAAILIFALLYILRPEVLRLPYAYLWLGLFVVLLPSIIVLALYPHLRRKVLDVSLYIFTLHLTLEIVFLHMGIASYPGAHFLGWVQITSIRFPIEELIYWMGMSAIATVTYYELCMDDLQ